MITIVDYGMGNLRSVEKALEKVGSETTITSEPQAVAEAEKLVLPGVGAFGDAMANLREKNLLDPIRDYLKIGRPFLGICLGLQLLFEKSYEDGEHEGLAVLGGKVLRFELPSDLKVPHMGWNQLKTTRRSPLQKDLPEEANFYFVHSYYVAADDSRIVATETEYGVTFTSMIWQENIFASQFHPEKSQRLGLVMLRNFAKL